MPCIGPGPSINQETFERHHGYQAVDVLCEFKALLEKHGLLGECSAHAMEWFRQHEARDALRARREENMKFQLEEQWGELRDRARALSERMEKARR